MSSSSVVVGIGVGVVSRVDHLGGIRSLITVNFHRALDSPSSISGLGDLGALVVLCIPVAFISSFIKPTCDHNSNPTTALFFPELNMLLTISSCSRL
ncbi:hypothetical protein Tco_0834306 [Tanacetum coccineum]